VPYLSLGLTAHSSRRFVDRVCVRAGLTAPTRDLERAARRVGRWAQRELAPAVLLPVLPDDVIDAPKYGWSVCLPWYEWHRRADRCTGHVRSHESIRPFACQWCARRFIREVHQRGHERDHCRMRPRGLPGAQPEEASARPSTRRLRFTCDICRKSFLTPHYLNRHCTCLRRSPHMVDDAFGQCIYTRLEERPPVARSARSGSTPQPRRFAQEICRWTSIRSAPCSPAVYSLQRLSANLGLVVELAAHVRTQDCWITYLLRVLVSET
jgi:hypothetical protein